MADNPAESEGAVRIEGATTEEMFNHLRENRDEKCVGIPFVGLGAMVMIRVNPLTPAGAELYDLTLMCMGDPETGHEAHPADTRELQTEEEVTALLVELKAQEAMQALQAMLAGMLN